MRFAVERPAVRRRVVVLRPPRFAVLRFAVPRFAVLRFAVLRFAVVLRRVVARFAVVFRRVVERFAVVFRPLALVPARRRVVLRSPPLDDEPLIGEGGGGVLLDGSGAGQTEPGSFCADQSVPWSSCMVPPQKSVERSRDAYRIPVGIARAGTAGSAALYGWRGDRRLGAGRGVEPVGTAHLAPRARSLRRPRHRSRAVATGARSPPRECAEPDPVRCAHPERLDALPVTLGNEADEDFARQEAPPRRQPSVRTLHQYQPRRLELA